MKSGMFMTGLVGLVIGLVVILVSGAGMYISVPRGTIHNAYIEYCDSNTIYITAGYGECNGNYWEVLAKGTYDLTSLTTTEGFRYIYIDDSDSAYPEPALADSSTAPSWSESKLGWYNGDDRCIGVIWNTSGSATITAFQNNANNECIMTNSWYKTVLTGGNPNGGWQGPLETTSYIPVNATALWATCTNTDSSDRVEVRLALYDNNRTWIQDIGYGMAQAIGWISMGRDMTNDLQWYGNDDDDNNFLICLGGYRIER